jgi:RpiR family transcriptional regulator, carbohydrate utilization regulator
MRGTQKRADQTAANEVYGKAIPDILAIIKDSYSELRPAERRVADVVLADITFAVDASNGDIAKRSDTSEPTVTRFCRAIGCEGVRDFKLKLARSTVVGRLYLDGHKERKPSGDRSPLWKEVFGEARAALAVVEDTLSPVDILKAAELISAARQVMIFGLGGSSTALAQEVQNRLFRYGVVAYAHADPISSR